MVVMESGTTYEGKNNGYGEGEISHKRFCQCPKCKERIYANSLNFRKVMDRAKKKK